MASGFFSCVRRFIIQVKRLFHLVTHILHGIARIDDPDSRTIGHEDGGHLEVDDHVNPEDAASVLGVFPDELLGTVYGLCLDVHALLPVCPELDAARRVADVLAHADDIIEENRSRDCPDTVCPPARRS